MRPPRLPWPVRTVNAIGRHLRAIGIGLPSLEESALLARATRNTGGLSDFGDPGFRDPLRRLLHSLEHEAHLTELGRLVARRDIVRLLENRLRMTAERRAHPEIDAGPIRRPLVIIGLPRTGTSILHELMALDPANRVPMTWEVMHPWPPPEQATFETDPRIATVEAHLSGVDRLLPDFKRIHPMGARLPQECVALTAHDFASILWHTTHDVPSYARWLEETDLRWVYASHRRQLQYLQWRAPAERWVLKSPGHLWALDALLAEYPDACIVQTHRDPLTVIASLASLLTVLRSLASDAIDPPAIAAEWTERLARGLEASMAIRDTGHLPAAQVFDVPFASFMRDPITMIRQIYDHFGLPRTAVAEERMRRFLAENPADKHGAHRYTLAAAGLDEATEARRYAAYRDRFGLRAEATG